MAALSNPKREAFAEALARGHPVLRAWEKAGFAYHATRARRRMAAPDMVARVAEIRRERDGDGPADLIPVINRCMILAEAAGKIGSAAGMAAARGLLAEAARLKRLLPPAPLSESWPEDRPELSDDEWLDKYGPKDPARA